MKFNSKLIKRIKAGIKAFRKPSLIQTELDKKLKPIIKKELKISIENKLLINKNILITGAGKNIGRAIAITMAEQGANIYFTDINNHYISNLEQELSMKNIKFKGFIADINNLEQTDNIINYFHVNKIKIDVLVNNVGIQSQKNGILAITHEERTKTFKTNVISPLYLTEKITQHMIENDIEGSIIFLSSIHQSMPMRIPSYSASKAAIKAIIRELAIDLSGYKIRVNGIAPGWVIEDESGNSLKHEYSLLHKKTIPPDYIARAAVYLASDYFSYFTTGSILKIDAGLSLFNHRVLQCPPSYKSI